MIDQPVVFVLGAGASVPYGYPTGKQLKKLALIDSREIDQGAYALTQAAKVISFKEKHTKLIKEFRDRFGGAGVPSIDSFLEMYIESMPDWQIFGKALIAGHLLECERNPFHLRQAGVKPPTIEDDWIEYLLNEMSSGVPPLDLPNSKVSFITFNYDHLLEHKIFNHVHGKYGLDRRDALGCVQQMRIVHVHGQLGVYNGPGRIYGQGLRNANLQDIVEKINIVHDKNIDKSEAFKEARRLIEEARCIIFIGFGYGQENLQRLLSGTQLKEKPTSILGSCYGLEDGEVKNIKNRMPLRRSILPIDSNSTAHFCAGNPDVDCLSFIRKYIDLWKPAKRINCC